MLRAIGITIVWSIIALLTLWAVAAFLRRLSDCVVARSGDFDLRSRDLRNFIHVQTILLDRHPVSRGLLLCARMVAHLKTLERRQLGS